MHQFIGLRNFEFWIKFEFIKKKQLLFIRICTVVPNSNGQ